MRKIEQEMVAAIKQRRNWKSSNTAVEVTKDGAIFVKLHGHIIAEASPYLGGTVKLADCGYQTATTKSRLNAVIKSLIGLNCGIFQKEYEWFFRRGDEIKRWSEVKGEWLGAGIFA
jgi:hypothetical protein